MKSSKINYKKIIDLFIIILMLLFSVFLVIGFSDELNKIIALCVIVLSCYLVFLYRNYILLSIVTLFLAFCNYSIVVGVYLDPTLRPMVLYKQINNIETYGIGIYLLFLFLCIFVIFSNEKGVSFKKMGNIIISKNKNNIFIVLCIACVLIAILLTGYKQGIGGNRGSSSPLYEYSLIFFIIGIYYSKNIFIMKIFWHIIIMVFSLNSFMNGNRVEAIMFLLVIFCFYYSFKFNFKKLLFAFFIGVFFMISIGFFRANFSLNSEVIKETFNLIIKSKFTFDTAIWAYFPMLSIVETSNFMTMQESLFLLKENIVYIFLGGKYSMYKVEFYIKQYFFHTNGVVSIGYFFLWIKYLSPILFYFVIHIYIYLTNVYRQSDLKKLLFIYFVCAVPRWYLYGPFILIRGALIFIIVYSLFKLIDKFKLKDLGR